MKTMLKRTRLRVRIVHEDQLLAAFTTGTQTLMTAARKLSPVISDDDPLWRTFLAAPFDPNPPSEQELLWLEQAKAGGATDGASITAEIARRAEREPDSDSV